MPCTDKAGNSYETVNIIDAGGKQVTETAGQGGKLLDFSINKGGSIFSLDDNTMKLVRITMCRRYTMMW